MVPGKVQKYLIVEKAVYLTVSFSKCSLNIHKTQYTLTHVFHKRNIHPPALPFTISHPVYLIQQGSPYYTQTFYSVTFQIFLFGKHKRRNHFYKTYKFYKLHCFCCADCHMRTWSQFILSIKKSERILQDKHFPVLWKNAS